MLEVLAPEDRDEQQQQGAETVAAARLHGRLSMPGSVSKWATKQRISFDSSTLMLTTARGPAT